MSLAEGTRLGPYEIKAQIGAGGMGEVYRATDTRLDRTVAIKVLPEHLADDPQRRERFEREAKAVSSLNHPHICTLHDVGKQDGIHSLVMELVEGDTLQQRLEKGRLPLDQALEYAIQIADALDKAHRQGVVHRDLKPGNIMITKSAGVKLLDFGLAKLKSDDAQVSPLSQMPTQDPSAPLTAEGTIIGTLQYMAPEQLEGKEADARTDIFAFGAVVYEMVTGKKAFEGASQASLIHSIMGVDPPSMAELQTMTPSSLDHIVTTCLDKDPDMRWQTAADLVRELKWMAARRQQEVEATLITTPKSRSLLLQSVVMAVLVVGTALGVFYQSRRSPTERLVSPGQQVPVMASDIQLPDGTPLAVGVMDYDITRIALSPDGRWLVFVGLDDGQTKLYRQRLGGFDAPEPIPGTDGATHAFFSPNGDRVGFLTVDLRMKQVKLTGEELLTVATTGFAPFARWAEDGWIYFGDDEGAMLRRVRPKGGEDPEDVMRLDGRFSDVLPDGRFALGISGQGIDKDYASILLIDLESKTSEVLPRSGYAPRWIPTGHLLFVRGSDVLATSFDPDSAVVGENSVAVLTGVATNSFFNHAQLAVSDNGSLAYVPGGDRATGRIAMIDRQSGEERVLPQPPRKYGAFDLSTDDSALAVHMADVDDYIWVYDVVRDQGRRLVGSDNGGWPKWSPDGTELAFTDSESGLKIKIIDNAALPRTVGTVATASSWSPDRTIAVHDYPVRRGFVRLGEQASTDWIDSPGIVQWGTVFSPDGEWVAYASDETGRMEIWVSSYPDGDTRRQIASISGGIEPVWCVCGEIFFRGLSSSRVNDWFAAKVATSPELDLESAERAFSLDQFLDTPGRSYDISSDGQTLFVVTHGESAANDRIRVIGNWFEELKRLVPADN